MNPSLTGAFVILTSVVVRRAVTLAFLMLGSGLAQAHPGHDPSSLVAGLAHPFGLDHLTAMVAVGVWSVSSMPGKTAWAGPLTFVAALAMGGLAGANGLTLPYLESWVSLGVVSIGVLLVQFRSAITAAMGLSVVAAVAALHGVAHGAEAPAGSIAAYMAGFLTTTLLMHAGGMMIGLLLRRDAHAFTMTRVLGA
jgi:urease accessory protein